MLAEIIEYEYALEKINKFDLKETQVETLLKIINENPSISAPKLIEISEKLSDNEIIILDSGTYSIEPILNESKIINLLEFALPAITRNIPKEIIGYLTETHARAIVDKIFNVEFDETTTPEQLYARIDEIFTSGDVSIPVQGLRRRPESEHVVLAGTFTQKLHKGIQFGKKFHNKPIKSHKHNRSLLKDALKDYKMIDEETPLMKILPKFIVSLKHLLGDEK